MPINKQLQQIKPCKMATLVVGPQREPPLQPVMKVEQRPGAGRPAAALAEPEDLEAVLPDQLEVRVEEEVQVGVERVAIEPADREVLVEVAEPDVEQQRRGEELRDHREA